MEEMQKVAVRTKGRKIGATGEIGNKYKHSKIFVSKGQKRVLQSFRTERKGERLCPEDGIDASGICKTHTGVFEGI